MDAAPFLGAAIPAVATVAGALINNHSVDQSNQSNQQFQLLQQDRQNAYNLKMWNLQNEYNDPIHTRQRLIDAGYNPALMYGSPTGNVASSPAPSARAEMVYQPHPSVDLGSAAASSIHAFNDIRLGSAQVDNTNANTSVAIQTAVSSAVRTALEVSGFANQQENVKAQTLNYNTEAGVKQFLAPHQADVADAQAYKDRVASKVALSENDRAAVRQGMDLKTAAQAILESRSRMATSQVERDRIAADISKLNSDNTAVQLENVLRRNGVPPQSSSWWQSIENFFGSGRMESQLNAVGSAPLSPGVINNIKNFKLRK